MARTVDPRLRGLPFFMVVLLLLEVGVGIVVFGQRDAVSSSWRSTAVGAVTSRPTGASRPRAVVTPQATARPEREGRPARAERSIPSSSRQRPGVEPWRGPGDDGVPAELRPYLVPAVDPGIRPEEHFPTEEEADPDPVRVEEEIVTEDGEE